MMSSISRGQHCTTKPPPTQPRLFRLPAHQERFLETGFACALDMGEVSHTCVHGLGQFHCDSLACWSGDSLGKCLRTAGDCHSRAKLRPSSLEVLLRVTEIGSDTIHSAQMEGNLELRMRKKSFQSVCAINPGPALQGSLPDR